MPLRAAECSQIHHFLFLSFLQRTNMKFDEGEEEEQRTTHWSSKTFSSRPLVWMHFVRPFAGKLRSMCGLLSFLIWSIVFHPMTLIVN